MGTVRALLLGSALTAAWLAPGVVRADEPEGSLSTEGLREELHRYFRAEKRGGAVLSGMGAPAVALGGGLLAQDRELWRGFAYPVLVIGALELIGGVIFYARTDRQVALLDRGLSTRPRGTRDAELGRMRRVNLQFSLLEGLEVTLLVGGVVLAAAGAAARSETTIGVGLGLSLQSAALLTFDLFAARRAHRYTDSLARLQLTAGPSLAPAGAAGGLTVSLLGGF